MLRSMFSGVSGLRNHQIKMDVVGNNIANVNTYGFKASRVTFQELYTQTMRSASTSSPTIGGRNPMQVGLGISTATVDVLHTTGGTQMTDSGLDLAINGEGFFTVSRGDFTYYTRVGNFAINPIDGALVNGSGLYLQGLMYDMVFYDEDGNAMTTPGGDPYWTPEFFGSGEDWPTYGGISREDTVVVYSETIDGTYDLRDPANAENIGRIYIPLNIDNIAIDARGVITGLTEGGDLIQIGQVLLTTFANPAGLTRVGSNLFIQSGNSGDPNINYPGEIGVGETIDSSLEMSNVDLSKEFTDMIITQRGFQANSRIITVSDSLLEELVNLKR